MADTEFEVTTVTGTDAIPQVRDEAAERYARIFKNDPVINYMLCNLSESARHDYRKDWFHTVMTASALNSGVFEFGPASSHACVAVWLPPKVRIDDPVTILRAGFITCVLRLGVGGAKRMIWDFQRAADQLKKRHLYDKGIKRFWYLFFMGTEEESRGQGLAGNVIRKFQERARSENLPIWLEATSEKSKRVYEKCGFELLETFVMGKGSHDQETGLRKQGGEGVRLWAMLWIPEGLGTKSSSTIESSQ